MYKDDGRFEHDKIICVALKIVVVVVEKGLLKKCHSHCVVAVVYVERDVFI